MAPKVLVCDQALSPSPLHTREGGHHFFPSFFLQSQWAWSQVMKMSALETVLLPSQPSGLDFCMFQKFGLHLLHLFPSTFVLQIHRPATSPASGSVLPSHSPPLTPPTESQLHAADKKDKRCWFLSLTAILKFDTGQVTNIHRHYWKSTLKVLKWPSLIAISFKIEEIFINSANSQKIHCWHCNKYIMKL